MGLLRLLLALCVVLTHLPIATLRLMNGALAVQAFFVVSGFYMALVLDGKYASARLFYTNRLLRIFPGYVAMLPVAALALLALDASATADRALFAMAFAHPWTALLLGIENLAIVGQEWLFWFRLTPDGALQFDAAGPLPDDVHHVGWQALLVPQSWSLSMELLFYALAPALARLRTGWLTLIAAASIGVRLTGHLLPVGYPVWQGRLFPAELFMFVFGMLAQRLLPVAARVPARTGWIGLALICGLIVLLPELHLPAEAAVWLLLIPLTLALPFIFSATRRLALDRWLGELSYPIYLVHLTVIGLVLKYAPPGAVWLALGGTLALALALQLLVDRPLDRWRQGRLQRGGAAAPAAEKVESQPISRVLS